VKLYPTYLCFIISLINMNPTWHSYAQGQESMLFKFYSLYNVIYKVKPHLFGQLTFK
jgi:hypothetical protein